MLNRDEIFQAVDLHQRSYSLLQWLTGAISRGFISFDRAHEYMDEAEAAEDWIKSHYLNLPPECRPEPDQLTVFARFFATYLTTSFELLKESGFQLTSSDGCYCCVCAHLVGASHLRTKKIHRRDKVRARDIKITTLKLLSHEHHAPLDQQHAEKIVDSKDTAKDVALMVYGQQLVARARGRSEGPAVLVLWREIAWDVTHPKKDFKLEAEDILRAEQSLVAAIVGFQ